MSRRHVRKSGGRGLECPRHGAERGLLAPMGETRYPPSGRAAFGWLRRESGAVLPLPMTLFSDGACARRGAFKCPFASRGTIPIRWRYVFQRTAGFEPAMNGELNPIEQDLGVSLDPLDCPVQATPGIRFGRASRTAVVSSTRTVGVLQVYCTILWGWIHGKKAANCMDLQLFFMKSPLLSA